jgi:hypothetical protein
MPSTWCQGVVDVVKTGKRPHFAIFKAENGRRDYANREVAQKRSL